MAGTEGDGQSQLMASCRCGQRSAPGDRGVGPQPPLQPQREAETAAPPPHTGVQSAGGRAYGPIGVDSVCSKRTASTHPRRDCKVSVEAPLCHVDVSGAAVSGTTGSRVATILVGPQREETGLFDLDGEPRSLGTCGEDGPEVVALHAVTTAGAAT